MMERDFLGLNIKNSAVVVREKAIEGFNDSGFVKGSGVPWPLSNKVSALPPFMIFKAGQDEKMPKLMHDQLTSSGFMTMSSPDAFDIKWRSGGLQRINQMHLTHDAKKLNISTSNACLKTHFAGATPKKHILGGVPVAAPCSHLPSSSAVAGTAEPCFSTKVTESAAQLTIFYGGTVKVFDDITPEKAQAIMFLACNVCTPPNLSQTRLPVQSPASKFAPGDAVFVNQTIHPQPSSAISSPVSVSSHPVGQSGGGSTNIDEAMAPKTTGISTNLVNKMEPLNMVACLGPVTAASIIPSAIPQARKASLARFLEKRKERMMYSAPYNLNKKYADCINPDSINDGSSAISIAGSSSLSTKQSDPMMARQCIAAPKVIIN